MFPLKTEKALFPEAILVSLVVAMENSHETIPLKLFLHNYTVR